MCMYTDILYTFYAPTVLYSTVQCSSSGVSCRVGIALLSKRRRRKNVAAVAFSADQAGMCFFLLLLLFILFLLLSSSLPPPNATAYKPFPMRSILSIPLRPFDSVAGVSELQVQIRAAT